MSHDDPVARRRHWMTSLHLEWHDTEGPVRTFKWHALFHDLKDTGRIAREPLTFYRCTSRFPHGGYLLDMTIPVVEERRHIVRVRGHDNGEVSVWCDDHSDRRECIGALAVRCVIGKPQMARLMFDNHPHSRLSNIQCTGCDKSITEHIVVCRHAGCYAPFHLDCVAWEADCPVCTGTKAFQYLPKVI